MITNNNIDKIFNPLYTSKKRYLFLTGGRGSTKTYNTHEFTAKLTYEKGHGILFTRYTMTSAEKSIIPEFKMTLDRLGIYEDFTITKGVAINKKTGSFIFFSGIKTNQGDQTANLKSLPNITTWIIEEGEDFNDEKTFDTIDDSIRQKGIDNRIIWIMNPTTREHFIYSRWVEKWQKQITIDGFNINIGNHPEVENIHSSYLIATKYLSKSFLKKAWKWRTRAKTGYCPIEKRELKEDEKIKSIKWYVNNYLGGWIDKAEGVVISNWSYGSFNPNNLQVSYGQDYGFSNDPTTLVAVAIDKKLKKIYAKELLYKTHLTTTQIADINKQHCGRSLIVGDSAEPRLISEVARLGCNIIPVKKPAGSISAGVMLLQDYEIIVEENSHNLVKEFNNHVYADKGSKTYKDTYNHLIDSLRYNVYFHLGQSNRVEIR